MSWKFNPPPGWPQQPEGWAPPPGWTPDPSWPPAPPGWQFWVPAAAGPGRDAGSTVHDAPTSIATSPVPGQSTPAGSPPASAPPGSSPPASSTPPAVGSYQGGSYQGGTYQSGTYQSGATSGPPAQSAPPMQSGPPMQSAPPMQSSPPMQGGQPAPGGQPNPAGVPAQSGPPGPYGGGVATPYPSAQPGPATPPGGYPPPAAPATTTPWHHRWWVFGAAAAAVLLAGCVAGSGVAMLTQSEEPDNPQPRPPIANPGPTGNPTDAPAPPPSGNGLAAGQERSGEGPAIVPLNLGTATYHTITVNYTGDGLFNAYLVDEVGENVGRSLAISFGSYSGTHLVELGRPGVPVAVDVTEADGAWSVTLQDLDDAPAWPDQTSGEGESILRIDQSAISGNTSVVGTHDGDSNFIVWAYTGEDVGDRLLFNEIGAYDGDSRDDLPGNAVVLEIRADGAWSIE